MTKAIDSLELDKFFSDDELQSLNLQCFKVGASTITSADIQILETLRQDTNLFNSINIPEYFTRELALKVAKYFKIQTQKILEVSGLDFKQKLVYDSIILEDEIEMIFGIRRQQREFRGTPICQS